MFCHRCGQRLATGARGAGVTYRRSQVGQSSGGGQSALAIAFVLLAGLLFAGGALAVFVSAPRAADTPTPLSGALVPTAGSTLQIFVQPTPSPSPSPSPFLSPSPLLTPLLTFFPSPSLFPSPTIAPTASPTQQPTQRPTPRPTRPPTPTPDPTPDATPVNCAAADGSKMRTVVLGFGNPESTGPISRTWCIHQVIFRPYLNEPGETRLLENDRRIAGDTCAAEECDPEKMKSFSPPHLTPAGSTLTYEFTCVDNKGTPENNECTDPIVGGSTIQIDYEAFKGP